MSENYKLYQLLSFFVMKFSYKTLQFKDMRQDEIWLVNPFHEFYPLIRITSKSIEQVIFEKARLDEQIENFKKRIGIKKGRFLDIHVYRDEVLEKEAYDSCAIETDYYAGLDLSDIYPGIKKVVHDVSNPELEVREIMQEIGSYSRQAKIQKRNLKAKFPKVTIITMALCLVMMLVATYINMNLADSQIDTLIVLGANYEMFTVGLVEFWRLLTSGLLHGSFIHLAMNMLSLYYLGYYLEMELGSLKFAITLFGSVILGSLCSLAFGTNGVSVGLSGGLYGLMAIYIMIAYKSGNLRSNYNLIYIIFLNVMISFMNGVDLFAHLGGFIGGICFYYLFFAKKQFFAIILTILLLVVSIKVYTVKEISPKYGGTDMAVVELYRKIGFVNHADNLLYRLNEVYLNK